MCVSCRRRRIDAGAEVTLWRSRDRSVTTSRKQVRPGDGPSVLDNVTSSCCQRTRRDSETETYRQRTGSRHMTSVWNSDVTDTCLRHHLMTSFRCASLADACCHHHHHYQKQQQQQQSSSTSGHQRCNSTSLNTLTVHQLPFECHCQRQRCCSRHRTTET